ncbi:hypothetical protein KOW79_011892 [Hemibagrus wyckioides]|uniref:Uncharacterized protein n=1 Tax=Hemibagrus wyckioides TaxID=337641 RepID=A0A9D3NHZ7_9TELE|nr:hypothetical protein KOW79_011892 [Hemibagrus wyckioides]
MGRIGRRAGSYALQIGRVGAQISGPVVLEGRGRCGSTQALAVELPAKFRESTGRFASYGSEVPRGAHENRALERRQTAGPGALAAACADFRVRISGSRPRETSQGSLDSSGSPLRDCIKMGRLGRRGRKLRGREVDARAVGFGPASRARESEVRGRCLGLRTVATEVPTEVWRGSASRSRATPRSPRPRDRFRSRVPEARPWSRSRQGRLEEACRSSARRQAVLELSRPNREASPESGGEEGSVARGVPRAQRDGPGLVDSSRPPRRACKIWGGSDGGRGSYAEGCRRDGMAEAIHRSSEEARWVLLVSAGERRCRADPWALPLAPRTVLRTQSKKRQSPRYRTGGGTRVSPGGPGPRAAARELLSRPLLSSALGARVGTVGRRRGAGGMVWQRPSTGALRRPAGSSSSPRENADAGQIRGPALGAADGSSDSSKKRQSPRYRTGGGTERAPGARPRAAARELLSWAAFLSSALGARVGTVG